MGIFSQELSHFAGLYKQPPAEILLLSLFEMDFVFGDKQAISLTLDTVK